MSPILLGGSLIRLFIRTWTMAQPTLRILVTSFPISRQPPPQHPELKLVDCSRLQPPSPATCNRFTGLEPEVAQAVFSNKTTNSLYVAVIRTLKQTIRDWDFREGRYLVVPVACRAGVHRSVAMAERIAKTISEWQRSPLSLAVQVWHQSLWRHVKRHRRDSRANWKRFVDLNERVHCGRDGTVRGLYYEGHPYDIEHPGVWRV